MSYLYVERQTIERNPLSQINSQKISWHRSEGKPRNFRKFEDMSCLQGNHSTYGVSQRRLSASGQFDEESLAKIKAKINPDYKIVVINLRRESCGFIEGKPVSWKDPSYNLGLSSQDIDDDEKKRLSPLQNNYDSAITEKVLVEQLGLDYKRMPVLDHHRFSDQAVEDVLTLLKEQGPNTWYHVKCHAGKGRTTQFMVIADMVWNAKKVSFQEILARQKAVGGANFKRHKIKGPLDSQYTAGKERLKFLKEFYRFCVDRNPHTDSWTSYVNSLR